MLVNLFAAVSWGVYILKWWLPPGGLIYFILKVTHTHTLTCSSQVFWLLGVNQANADNARHHFALLSVWTHQIKTTKYYALKQLTNVDIKFCAFFRRISCQQEPFELTDRWTLSALWDDLFVECGQPPLQKLPLSPNIRTKSCSTCQFRDVTANRYWSFHIIYH